MIWRFLRRKHAAKLRDQLKQAREQRRAVEREGSEVADLTDRLHRHLARNSFAERIIAQLDSSRRSP